ncbi:MAG: ParA family protein [Anaerolineae bacterium]|nr:ParA family protein [Anaerolineae bacterium]
MTRIISVLNFKGGTGKTTTVVNLGMALALRGFRVLAIDLDHQGSLAKWLGVPTPLTMAEVLLGQAEWPDAVQRARTRFDVLPSDRRLADAQETLIQHHANPSILESRLRGITSAGYDFIFLDCAPSINFLAEAALYFSKEVFIPISMEFLALVGAREVIIEILRARRLFSSHTARISLVIPSFYDVRHAKSHQTLRMLEEYFPGIVSNPIRATVRLSEAPGHQQTIFEYDPKGPGSQDFAELAERVIRNEH